MDALAQADISRKYGFDVLFELYFGIFDFLQESYDIKDPIKQLQFNTIQIFARAGLGSMMPNNGA